MAATTAPGATATVHLRGGVATVTVVVGADLLGVDYRVDATAVAPLEPGAARPARRR